MKNTKTKLHLAALPSKRTNAVARIARRALEDGLFLPRNRAAREQVLAQEREASGAGISIFDRYFSVEQQVQINRLENACDFEGRTEREAHDKTIATLAQAALWVLGLDPLSRDSFERISDVVLGKAVDADYYNALNDQWHAADNWTLAQRAAEIGETPRSEKAEAATL